MPTLAEYTLPHRIKLAKRLQREGISELSSMPYEKYLRSALWRAIREWVIDANAGKCSVCDRKAEEVHHHDYEHLTMWGEASQGLTALCARCHSLVEFDGGVTKRESMAEKRQAYDRLCETFANMRARGFELQITNAKRVTRVEYVGDHAFLEFQTCDSLAFEFIVWLPYKDICFPLPFGRAKLTQKTGARLSARDGGAHLATVWADSASITLKTTSNCAYPFEERFRAHAAIHPYVRVVA